MTETAKAPPSAEPCASPAKDVRERILDSAVELFFGHGCAPTRQIAALTGVSQALVTHYFKKDELMGAISRQVSTNFIASLDGALAGNHPPEQQLVRIINSFMESMHLNQKPFRVYWKELQSIPGDEARQARALEKEYVTRVAHVVAAAQKQGTLPSHHDPWILTKGLLGMLSWTHWWYRPDRHTPQQIAAAFRDLIGLGDTAFFYPPARSPGISPRRRRLIDSATHIFSLRGYNEATVEEIAAHAGVNDPHTPQAIKKDHLLGDIAQRVSTEFTDALDWELGPVQEQLTQIIESFLRSIHVNQDPFAVYWKEYNSIPAKDAIEARARERSFVARVIGVVAAGQEEGLLPRQHDPLILAEAILGMLSWTHWWYRPQRHDLKEIAAAFCSLIRLDHSRDQPFGDRSSSGCSKALREPAAPAAQTPTAARGEHHLPPHLDSKALTKAILSVQHRPGVHPRRQLASAIRDLLNSQSPRRWYPPTEAPGWSGMRRRILDSAASVFFERGYDAGTTKEIAAREGVSQGLISQYFKKNELMGAIAQRMSIEFTVALDQALGTVQEQLLLAIQVYAGTVHAHNEAVAVYWAEHKSLPAQISRTVRAQERLFTTRVSNVVAAAQGQGILPSQHEPGVLTEGLLRMTYWLHCVHWGCKTTPKETAKTICHLIRVNTAADSG